MVMVLGKERRVVATVGVKDTLMQITRHFNVSLFDRPNPDHNRIVQYFPVICGENNWFEYRKY